MVLSKFDRCFDSPPLTREQFLELYRAKTLVCEVSEIVMDCRDPKDNKFLALALAAQADVLVTGDGRRETGATYSKCTLTVECLSLVQGIFSGSFPIARGASWFYC